MRILLVSNDFPDDPDRKVHGVFQRLRMLVDALAGLGRLEALFFVGPDVDTSPEGTKAYRRRLADSWSVDLDLELVRREPWPEKPSRWDTYGRGTLDAFRAGKFHGVDGRPQRAAVEAALGRSPDLLFAHRLTAMVPVLGASIRRPPVVFDLDDVEHVAFLRSVSQPPVWWARRLEYLKVPALWWAERRAISLARRTFVCSEKDRRYLTRTMRVSGVTVIPNAVEPRKPMRPPARPTAMFIGSLDYGPNRNAAGLLAREIWPRVRRLVPDAELTIGGRYPERVPGHGDGSPGVMFPGFVSDLDALYARSRVVCVPIRSGGGTRIKILEAAAFAKPIVSTRVGAEGLDFVDGVHLLERSGVDAFARAVAELMRDDAACERLGRAAHELVKTRYAREQVVGRIRQVVGSAFD